MSNKIAVQKWRKKTKALVVEAMGNKCCKCGYDKYIEALTFHHLDPNAKDNTIANFLRNPRRLDKIVCELKKCVMLCANCHIELHAGHWDISDITIIEINESIIEDGRKSKRVTGKCPVCNGDTSGTNTCSRNCAAKLARTIDWPDISVVLDMLSKSNYSAVGRELGVSVAAVKKYIRKHKQLGQDSNLQLGTSPDGLTGRSDIVPGT